MVRFPSPAALPHRPANPSLFRDLITDIDQALGLTHHKPRVLPEHAAYLHQRTAGRIGSLTRLIRQAAITVPETGGPAGTAVMEAHIKLDSKAATSPRVRFLDDTKGTTQMIVLGYIGPPAQHEDHCRPRRRDHSRRLPLTHDVAAQRPQPMSSRCTPQPTSFFTLLPSRAAACLNLRQPYIRAYDKSRGFRVPAPYATAVRGRSGSGSTLW